MSAALAVSGSVFAQAPVINATDSTSLEQRIVVLERIVKSRTEMQHRLQEQLDNMQSEVDQLRGSVELNTNELEKVLERQRELYLEIDKRVEALKQAGIAGTGTPSAANSPMSQPTPSVSQAPQEGEEDAYNKAVNLILNSREYDKAIPAFETFIDRFPNSEYTPNAHYWLGQLLFNKQMWDEATAQFNTVVTRFTDSAKRPEALLKLGVIAERKGDIATAKTLFQQVVNEYPSSSAKRLAESRLNNL